MSVLAFFYIARLRIVMVPTLGLFVGAGAAGAVELWRKKAWRHLGVAACVGLSAVAVSMAPILQADTSNEWNKAGIVLRTRGDLAEAEDALMRAREANPRNPNTYLNLAVLYREAGRADDAQGAEARARDILAGQRAEGEDFRRVLEGQRP